jgi:hypothetical protein
MVKLLCAHYRSKNRTSIFRVLAREAGYKNWRAVNLQYGLLAKRIGLRMKIRAPDIRLLLDFGEPGELRNQEWLAFMRPEFAVALKRVGWV